MVRKKMIEIKLNQPEPPKDVKSAKSEFAALIEKYKAENPAKYELKKKALEEQLSKL